MQFRALAFAAVFAAHSAPVLAFDNVSVSPAPRAITSFQLGEKQFELSAVGRRGHADTMLRRAHLNESRAMGKVYPGYQQPAFVTFDIRFKF